MRYAIINLLKQTPLYHQLRNFFQRQRQTNELVLWEQNGRSAPVPHLIKQRVLREYARKYKLRILVETGTHLGDMVEAMKGAFDEIISIELGAHLFEMAKKRFSRDKHVKIISGDSSSELANVVEKIQQPALFWLDGHYSGGETARGDKDCPIYAELDCISSGSVLQHVIIIDDARLFGVDPAYPTLDDLRRYVACKWRNAEIAVQDDSIRITPVQALASKD